MIALADLTWKPLLRKLVTGSWRRFRMRPLELPFPVNLKKAGLYLHVPFCRSLCPFCPYNRFEYDEDLFRKYEAALHEEIELYGRGLNGCDFDSLYIGGGTPTIHVPGLLRILKHVKETFSSLGDICIELHPVHMDQDCLESLKGFGVTLLSIGVESASDQILRRIGRNHDGITALEALHRALDIGFDSVNADLMFALPGQTLEDWASDLKKVIKSGVDQISTYPLFSFPYSDFGREVHLPRVKHADGRLVRSMLDLADALLTASGYERCAVWSWLKPSRKKYSSVTRQHYIGLGPGAASMTGRDFYLNTFHIDSYIEAVHRKRPIAVSMPVDRRLEMAYWLYWRIYELRINREEFVNLFGDAPEWDSFCTRFLEPLTQVGMMEKTRGGYLVTKSGAYWIHRLQNAYSLHYIDSLWGTCRRVPWPAEILL